MGKLLTTAILLFCFLTTAAAQPSDISGTWRNEVVGMGASSWTFTRSGNQYQAREAGMGGATGTASYDGSTIRLTFVAGAHRGTYTWTLGSDGNSTSGSLNFTAGPNQGKSYNAKLTREGGAEPAIDVTGSWKNNTPGIGSSTWIITRRSDGLYDARETGMGNTTGTATFQGGLLQISWSSGEWKGIYTWSLDYQGRSGSGQLNFTAGPRKGQTFSSSVSR